MGVVVRRAEPGDQRGLTTLVGKAGGPSMVSEEVYLKECSEEKSTVTKCLFF